MQQDMIHTVPLEKILERYPYTFDFLVGLRLEDIDRSQPLALSMDNVPEEYLEDFGYDRAGFLAHFASFLEEMEHLKSEGKPRVSSLEVVGGRDKYGRAEKAGFTIRPGEIISVVGPTGSGKSRLLGDIECLAQGDTPTGRRVLVNGESPGEEMRFNVENRMIAQLSQNMNFVMDVSVRGFIDMHAQSRMAQDPECMVREIFECANELAGEKFGLDVTVTQLSGGQSRALMIADTALLSDSPIVLIDEIENAGIDRRKAVGLLAKRDKIILMSTHDPLLALMADKRVVIKDGGISTIIKTQEQERACLCFLERVDGKLLGLRELLRNGGTMDYDIEKDFQNIFSGRKI